MRVITFSRYFPANHPRKGQPTNFVEKIWEGLEQHTKLGFDFSVLPEEFNSINENDFIPKYHTIRAVKPHLKAGFRWDVGDWFSPRVWSGKPYCSKQIEFAPPIQIKRIWDFEMRIEKDGGDDIQLLYINNREYLWYDGGYNDDTLKRLCQNDGLSENDFISWFLVHPKLKENGFVGQILCWNEKIEY